VTAESRTFADAAADKQLSIMAVENMLDDGEAQPYAAVITTTALIHPEKALG
jgi:hypothetical protein